MGSSAFRGWWGVNFSDANSLAEFQGGVYGHMMTVNHYKCCQKNIVLYVYIAVIHFSVNLFPEFG